MPKSASDILLKQVGARIAEVRRRRGLTQEALAERMGTNGKHIQSIERGSENLTLRSIHSLAENLEISPWSLFLPTTLKRRAGRPRKQELSQEPSLSPITHPRPGDIHRSVAPLLSLVAHAGYSDRVEMVEISSWVKLPEHQSAQNLFVAQVQGDSMQPDIPSGAFALFRAPIQGSLDGKTLLIEHREQGSDLSSYSLKRAQILLDANERPELKLISNNPQKAARTVPLNQTGEGGARIVAELIKLLDLS